MLRNLIARALIACLCMAPAAVALGDVSWQADSGNSSLILDLDSLAELGVEVKSDVVESQPGVFRNELIGPSNLVIDSMGGEITATSGGTLIHAGHLSLIATKEGTGLSLGSLAFEIPSGNEITSLLINDATTGQTLFRVDSVRAVYAPVSRILVLEGGSIVGTKALATSLHIEALDGAVFGQLHARFAMAWAGGDNPSSDPGYPQGGASPRGIIDCNGSTGQDLIVGVLTTLNNPASQQIGGVWYDTFSVGTTSCNIGDQILTWDGSSGFVHPVIGQNCFRLKNGRFEQIGQSWLKHGFTVAAGNACGCGCTGPGGPTLYPGCSDPYGATLNNSQGSIKPKWRVNPTLGTHDHAESAPAVTGSASRRLQVRHTDVDPTLNSGALYFIEGQYVHAEDSASGNANNNASYSQITVASAGTNEYTFTLTGSTNREDCGIRAWQDTDPTVTETDVIVPNEGLYVIASKATNNGNGTWHYEYAVQNLNGNRGASSFSVPIDPTATVSNIGFHDVDYHSGDGEGNVSRDGTDWNGVHSGSSVTWTMSDVGLNSNALLWGTMYNFRFDANRPPAANNPNATLTHWRSGTPATSQGAVQGPDIGPQDCQPNGVEDGTDIANGTSQDCNNDGVPDECQTFAPSTLTLEIVVSGLGTDKPVFVCAPPGDTGRLFIVTQVGRIYIYNLVTQTMNATPFLDIQSQTTTDGERGLLGMAFHPNYASNGKFYINHTNLSGNTLIREFTVSGNPDIANAGSGVTLKTINQDFSNHNAGCLQFSPVDGYLYAAMGDGGAANDPNERSQNDNSLLGKILRLDVDNPPSYTPPSNPGVLPEVWAKGMRNPWRWSFDRLTGDMYIGDVGQDTREEVDFQPATSAGGENYGWDCREGLIAAPGDGIDNFGCNAGAGGYTDPILDYNTQDGNNCTIIGGYVYRGCNIPWLNGTYFYADWCADWVKTFRYDGSTLSDQQDVTADLNDGIAGTMSSIVSFGEDAAGELYVVTYGGTIYRIIEAGPPPVCGNNIVENGEQCDDGNTQAGDGCSPTCQNEIPVCGNNLVDVGEECDDGNTNDGDGCDSTCHSENIPGADNCADAPPIADGVYDFDTTAATTDGNAHGSCQFDGQTYNDIWWQYNATCSGNLTVSLCGSGYDTDLAIYNTCTCTPGDANLAGCNDDGCPGSAPDSYRSQLTVPVVSGNCYLIRVGGWNSSSLGVGTMTISNSGAPCNTCGNGVLESGEECDDGNTTNGDGCSGICQFEFDDCNNNSIDDLVDIAMGTSQDCNNNSIPDECETGDDCNNNGILDACELADGSAADCNNNGVLDECDVPFSPAETKTYPVNSALAIPDNNATGASSTFNVPDSGTILDVNVGVDITHTYLGDLNIDISHGGVNVVLFNVCGNNDNMNVTFDDEGVALVCASPTTGTVLPTSPLSAFDGMDKVGDWTIRVVDTAGQDVGTLNTWTLVIENEGSGTSGADCNNNGIDDAIDMAQGTESDCDANCVPDSCQIALDANLDCNNNGELDSCELAGDPSLDCDGGPIGDPAGGQAIIGSICFGCHNVDGSGGPGFPGPNIRNKSRTFLSNFLPPPTDHPGGAFNYSAQQFADLEAFLSDTGGRGRPDGVLDSCQAPLADCDMDGQSDGCELNSGTQVDLDHSGVPDDCEGALTGACCMANGTCIVETESECTTAGGTYQGDSVGCTPNPCPQPTGACCFGDGTCSVETASDCSSMGGTYQGDSVSCTPNPCPQPTGACCFGDGTCSVETSSDCSTMGGTYQGNGSVCTPNPCPQPTGACCLSSGTCSVVTEAACMTAGGTYQGDGASCTPNPCPQPTGACCFGDGSCSEETSSDCSTMGGAYLGNSVSCTPNPCDQPMGSCCMAGSCSEATETDCLNGGGEYLGDGTTCVVTGCPPVNDNCVDALPIFNGVTPYSTVDATTDGPDEPGACTKFSDTQVGSDIWFCYVATCTGDLTVSTCGDADYDTKLAIYAGCSCPVTSALACQDDSPGCAGNSTELVVSVVQGNSYLLRVGGYNDASGTGNLTITCDGTCSGAPDGDLNEDGSVNGLDIHYLVDGLMNGATPAEICHGDYDASTDLDMADVPFIVDALLGL
ncbi:MAG: PQQ-dependent sugar dehydrogenase [Phycisphaerales bacterium]|nr:PQQ-dependent sugar dehydrogenase [Phycisphaerales bacterium]MCB9856928.1 PQQ-dependent sugar dehydrogenase [Phycisphaerales bacterium]MCB9861945.1 PQQ-dependent sugar dehydrogenase [Phycisphaerales bacterium]